jgi:hypothetical protein
MQPHYIYRGPIFTLTSPGRRIFHTYLNTSDSNLEYLFASFYCYCGGYVYHANRQLYGPFLTRTRLGENTAIGPIVDLFYFESI